MFGTSLPASLSKWLLKKNISCYVLLPDHISLTGCLFYGEILSNLCIVILCYPGCDVKNFQINVIFLIKPLTVDQKVKAKILISYEWEELLRRNKKHFSSFLKSFYWSKLKEFSMEGESPTLNNELLSKQWGCCNNIIKSYMLIQITWHQVFGKVFDVINKI